MSQTGLFKAIRYFGTQRKLANAIGVTQPAVSQWLCREQKIPYAQVVKIVDATGGYVGLHELAPLEKAANRAIQRLITKDASSVVEIPISLVSAGNQCCSIYREVEDVVEVMTQEELARPVVIDNNNQLITCECRLRARRLLKQKTVKVYALDLGAVVRHEQPIDRLLPLLPISERVALGQALEKHLGNRRGQRTDLQQLPQNFAEVTLTGGAETRQVVAKLVGFGNHETYRTAKQIVNNRTTKIIRAMDQRLVSIFKAAQVSRLPEKKQQDYIGQIVTKKHIKKLSTTNKPRG